MWTDTLVPELSNADWVEQASAALLRLDPSMKGPEVHGLALVLCGRPRWRAMGPEQAARKAFDEPEAVDGV